MSNEPSEFSESGSPILRHTERQWESEPAIGDEAKIELISAHIQRHIGEPATVFHELVSDIVHVDVHIVAPTEERNYVTLVTSGMSDRPMTVPPEATELAHAELMLCLPPDWPMDQEDFKNESHYWPVRLLKFLARIPHEYETWLGPGHTVPNGDPAEPLADGIGFIGAVVAPQQLAPEGFDTLDAGDGKVINFYAVLPLYQEEMEFKLKKGAEALFERLAGNEVTELVDVHRKSVAKRFLGLF
jgi:hypothetical protein